MFYFIVVFIHIILDEIIKLNKKQQKVSRGRGRGRGQGRGRGDGRPARGRGGSGIRGREHYF